MSRLGNIRSGVITALGTALGPSSFNHEDGYLMTPPTPPCFEVDLPENGWTFGPAFSRGQDTVQIIVRGIVQLGDANNGQKTLDEWLDPSGTDSVVAALSASPRTLGGTVDDLYVRSVSAPKQITLADGRTLLCAEWLVDLSLTP